MGGVQPRYETLQTMPDVEAFERVLPASRDGGSEAAVMQGVLACDGKTVATR